MEWIKVNEDGEIELVSEEIKLVPEVQALTTYEYNKAPGDSAGRMRKRAKQELMFLYLAFSAKSPYKDYTKEEQYAEALKDCGLPSDWKPSKEFEALKKRYVEANPNKIVRLLATAEGVVDKLRNFLDNIDLTERNESGGLVHSTASVLKTLSELPTVAQTITELERQARTDTIQKLGVKGDHQMGWMRGGKPHGKDIRTNQPDTEEDKGELQ